MGRALAGVAQAVDLRIMMNVIHTIPSLGISGGGPPRSVSQLCDALIAQSLNVSILTAVDENDPVVELHPSINLMKLNSFGPSTLSRLKASGFRDALFHAKNSLGLDVVHQHGIWLRSSHDVTSFAFKNRLPLVVSPRGMLEPWALNNSRWKKKAAWLLYQQKDLEKVSAFHATAYSEAESIRRLGFKQPVAVIPNGVELPKPKTGNRKTGNRVKTALFLSRINPKKGLPMLLDAWKKLAPADWRLVIAGNDDSNHMPELECQIAELGLSDQVELVGPLFAEAKEVAYRNADLFVLPSYSENFGIVVTEALGYQLPVLTTTGCPWQELEAHGCGWWVDPTLEGIQSGLNEALGTKNEELAVMGKRGRRLVESKYQWPGIAERMLEFYEWILNGGQQPDFVV